jgi:hypothetical protein
MSTWTTRVISKGSLQQGLLPLISQSVEVVGFEGSGLIIYQIR